MSSVPSLSADKQRRLQDVLAEYLEALEAGRTPNREELVARHPDLAMELSEFFANHDEIAQLAEAGVTRVKSGSEQPIAAATVPSRGIGDYEFQHEIARGGMGVVYRARQISLNRVVALKMLLPGQTASARTLRRFRVEAEAAAQLDHPNIVPIFEVGEIDGQPYFTMKLIEGGCLASRLEEFRLPPNSRAVPQKGAPLAELLATVARAVHHAHQRGVLHRDLKPANILLDTDNRPMVADFGLAKRVAQDPGLTQAQTVIGTASYMPPEQANAQNDDLTTAADVYSLGAILYELLTGKPPFVGATYFDTLAQVVEDPPVPPRQVNPAVPADLEAICLKCLQKEPDKRYPSAQTLAEDLDRWRKGEAISLRRLTVKERTRRWVQRNRLAAALLATVALLMIAVTIGSLVAAWQIAAARDDANAKAQQNASLAALEHEARTATEKAQSETQRLLLASYITNGTRALDDGDVFSSLVWYSEALRRDRGDPAREDAHRVRLAGALRRCPRLVQVWFGNETALPALSPDGRRVLLTQKDVVRAWDVASGQAVGAAMKHNGEVKRVGFSADGKRIVTVATDATARVWDATTGQAITQPLHHTKTISWAVFSPEGDRLATVGDTGARVWDAATGKLLAGPLVHDVPLLFASFSSDGKRLVTCGGIGGEGTLPRGEVRVWDLTAAKPTSQTLSRGQVVHWAHLTADGEHIVAAAGRRIGYCWSLTAGKSAPPGVSFVRMDPHGAVGPDPARVVKLDGSTAQVYDLAQGKPIGAPMVHGGEITVTAFSPDGRLVATAARDRTARVWDAATGKPLTPPLTTPLAHIKVVGHAAFSADGKRLLLTEGGQVCVWDLEPHDLGQALKPLPAAVTAALSPDGRRVAVVDKDGAVSLRDAVSDKLLHGPLKLPGSIVAVAFSPDGQRLFVVANAEARIWDTATGKTITAVLPHTGAVHRLLFTPDGSRAVIFASKDKTTDLIEVYDSGTGAATSTSFTKEKMPAFGLVMTPDGRHLIAAPPPGQVQNIEFRDVATGEPWKGPFRHAARVVGAAVSPNGTLLATATADGSAFLWDIDTGRPAGPTLQHGRPLHQIAFSGDGRRLVTLAEDQSARVWDVATGQAVTPLLTHGQPMVQAMLSADGTRLTMWPRTGAGWVWDLSPDPRPVDDLLYLTQLLSGQVLDSQTGGLVSAEGGNLRATWPDLRARFPHEFAP